MRNNRRIIAVGIMSVVLAVVVAGYSFADAGGASGYDPNFVAMLRTLIAEQIASMTSSTGSSAVAVNTSPATVYQPAGAQEAPFTFSVGMGTADETAVAATNSTNPTPSAETSTSTPTTVAATATDSTDTTALLAQIQQLTVDLRAVQQQLIATEDARNKLQARIETIGKPYLGVQWQNVQGYIYVMDVVPGSAAARAGLPGGVYLTHIGNDYVTPTTFRDVVWQYLPGETVQVTYVQAGVEKTVAVRLDRDPNT